MGLNIHIPKIFCALGIDVTVVAPAAFRQAVTAATLKAGGIPPHLIAPTIRCAGHLGITLKTLRAQFGTPPPGHSSVELAEVGAVMYALRTGTSSLADARNRLIGSVRGDFEVPLDGPFPEIFGPEVVASGLPTTTDDAGPERQPKLLPLAGYIAGAAIFLVALPDDHFNALHLLAGAYYACDPEVAAAFGRFTVPPHLWLEAQDKYLACALRLQERDECAAVGGDAYWSQGLAPADCLDTFCWLIRPLFMSGLSTAEIESLVCRYIDSIPSPWESRYGTIFDAFGILLDKGPPPGEFGIAAILADVVPPEPSELVAILEERIAAHAGIRAS